MDTPSTWNRANYQPFLIDGDVESPLKQLVERYVKKAEKLARINQFDAAAFYSEAADNVRRLVTNG
jgi:hypothetical protein